MYVSGVPSTVTKNISSFTLPRPHTQTSPSSTWTAMPCPKPGGSVSAPFCRDEVEPGGEHQPFVDAGEIAQLEHAVAHLDGALALDVAVAAADALRDGVLAGAVGPHHRLRELTEVHVEFDPAGAAAEVPVRRGTRVDDVAELPGDGVAGAGDLELVVAVEVGRVHAGAVEVVVGERLAAAALR